MLEIKISKWLEKEENKVLERRKNDKKNLAIGYSYASYELPAKHLEQYVDVLKHVKELARWNRMEHVVYETAKSVDPNVFILDSENIEDNLKKLKEIYQDGIVLFEFSLIKDLRNSEEIEDFLSSLYLLSHKKTRWPQGIHTKLYFKDETVLKVGYRISPESFEIDFGIYVEYRDNNWDKAKVIKVDDILVVKVLKDGLFSEYLYRLLKTAKNCEEVAKNYVKMKVKKWKSSLEYVDIAFYIDAETGRFSCRCFPGQGDLMWKIKKVVKENSITFHDFITSLQKDTVESIQRIML